MHIYTENFAICKKLNRSAQDLIENLTYFIVYPFVILKSLNLYYLD